MQAITLGRYGRFATPNQANSGYILKQNDTRIIVDFGSGCMGESLKHTDFLDVSAIIVSHLHYDHMSDLYTLGYYLALKKHRIKLFCPKTPAYIIDSLKQFNYDIIFYQDETISIGDFQIKAMTANHTVECYSLLINNILLYTADIKSLDNLSNCLDGLNAVIGDACELEQDYNDKSLHISVKRLAESIPKQTIFYLAHLAYGQEELLLKEAKTYHTLSFIVPDNFCI